jgi:hypothetical protein
MKNYFLIFFILACSLAQAMPPESVVQLSTKVILSNNNGYYVLSDNTCWKVIYFSKRWRSLSEWWNDVKLVPETFECAPKDWIEGSYIEVYSKRDFPEIPLQNASNQDDLINCSHVLINSTSKQVLFANALTTADCMVLLFNQAHEDGYNEGYTRGHSLGYSLGYSTGYQAGLSARPPCCRLVQKKASPKSKQKRQAKGGGKYGTTTINRK